MAEIHALFANNSRWPGMYLYAQQPIEEPNAPAQFGLFCAVRPEDPSAQVIHFVSEKWNRSDFCAVYEDAGQITRQRFVRLANALTPQQQWSESGLSHRLWVINDTVTIEALRKDFADRVLYLYTGQAEYTDAITAQKEQLLPTPLCFFLSAHLDFLPPENIIKTQKGELL